MLKRQIKKKNKENYTSRCFVRTCVEKRMTMNHDCVLCDSVHFELCTERGMKCIVANADKNNTVRSHPNEALIHTLRRSQDIRLPCIIHNVLKLYEMKNKKKL